MLLFCNSILFVVGIFLMLTGSLQLSRKRIVSGNPARLAGFFLFIPGLILLARYLYETVITGNTAQVDALSSSSLEVGIAFGGVILALIILFTAPFRPANAPPEELPDFLTVAAAAQYLQTTDAEIRQMIESGRLRAFAIGTDYRISRYAVEALRDH